MPSAGVELSSSVIGHDGVIRLPRHPVNRTGDPQPPAGSPRGMSAALLPGPVGPTHGHKSCIPGTELYPLWPINERRFRDPCPASPCPAWGRNQDGDNDISSPLSTQRVPYAAPYPRQEPSHPYCP